MHTTTTTSLSRCDDRPDRFDTWLRLAAHVVAYTVSGAWIRVRLARLFVLAADMYLRATGGRMSVLLPSRTGGGDHSYRAVVHGSPMVFGGCRSMGVTSRGRNATIEVVVRSKRGDGWIATRRTMSMCYTLAWPATCTAPEGQAA